MLPRIFEWLRKLEPTAPEPTINGAPLPEQPVALLFVCECHLPFRGGFPTFYATKKYFLTEADRVPSNRKIAWAPCPLFDAAGAHAAEKRFDSNAPRYHTTVVQDWNALTVKGDA